MFYFVGMVNSRFGSLIVEPFLKLTRIVVFEKYDRFVKAEKIDPKITLLSQENNVYRSYLSAMCITLLLLGYEHLSIICPLLKENANFILVFSLSVLFLFSYIKQTGFVKKRIKANLDK